MQIISTNLGLDSVRVLKAFLNGTRQHSGAAPPRFIIAKLSSIMDKIKYFKASHHLKSSDIYITDDVSKETSELRGGKNDVLKGKRRPGLLAYFSELTLFTGDGMNNGT